MVVHSICVVFACNKVTYPLTACSIVTPGVKVTSQKFSIIRTVSRQLFLEHDMSLQFEDLVPGILK